MSLYIPGLNLPPKGEKPITLMIFHDGSIWYYDDEAGSVKAIEVPPHGRLGDLDALIKTMREHGYNLVSADLIDALAPIIPADKEDS